MSEHRESCLFCRIAAGEMGTAFVAEGEAWVAFRDIDPRAPEHVLVVPRAHVSSLAELADEALAADLLLACASVARQLGMEAGYRVVTNIGSDGGQAVLHLHFHVLGGRRMRWPPG